MGRASRPAALRLLVLAYHAVAPDKFPVYRLGLSELASRDEGKVARRLGSHPVELRFACAYCPFGMQNRVWTRSLRAGRQYQRGQ
jgi:hypothetical protein